MSLCCAEQIHLGVTPADLAQILKSHCASIYIFLNFLLFFFFTAAVLTHVLKSHSIFPMQVYFSSKSHFYIVSFR